MVAVILTIHSLIILTLIGVVLLQRSEGGAVLSGGGFMTGRGTANALTRTTSVLATFFFATSLALAIIAGRGREEVSAVGSLTGDASSLTAGTPETTDDLLRSLGAEESAPAAPAVAPAAAPPVREEPAPAEIPPAPEGGGEEPNP
jgi:preprotein translocase subunit SecG